MTRRSSDGFTLIEVLIALAIASVALITALKTFGHSADVTSAAHERFLASLSAENSLHEIWATSAIPGVGETSSACPQARRPFVCQRSIIATPHPNFFRIEVIVRDGDSRILARRIGFYAKDMP
jgi:general secretion pathway protein I